MYPHIEEVHIRLFSEENQTPKKDRLISNFIENSEIKSSAITISERHVKVKGAVMEESRA